MSLLESILFAGRRSFSVIVPHVVVRETGRDDLVITEHPVERGATISDHAFKRPSQVEISCAWSDTKAFPGYVQLVYAQILELQDRREPFNVVTGKRSYRNMLLASLSVVSDEKSETALVVSAIFREVRIVTTQSTSGSTPPQENQKSPAQTAPMTDQGTKSAVAPSGPANSITKPYPIPQDASGP